MKPSIAKKLMAIYTILLCVCAFQAFASVKSASVKSVSGKVNIISGAGASRKATIGMRISADDKISTSRSSSCTILLDNGSKATLSGDTTVILNAIPINTSTQQNSLGLLQGGITVSAAGDLHVNTPTAVAGVRGTEFTVFVDLNSLVTELFVKEGIVDFGNDLTNVKDFTLNEKAIADTKGGITNETFKSDELKDILKEKEQLLNATDIKNPVEIMGNIQLVFSGVVQNYERILDHLKKIKVEMSALNHQDDAILTANKEILLFKNRKEALLILMDALAMQQKDNKALQAIYNIVLNDLVKANNLEIEILKESRQIETTYSYFASDLEIEADLIYSAR